jgi:ribonuclease HI
MVEVTIITDGSCIGNPGPGGWACMLRGCDREKELVGSHPDTTSNRMELTAAIEGLRALRARCRVRLVTDSQYAKKGITEHLSKWRSNGFRKSNGDPVLNQDLWDQLDQVSQKHEIHWEWTAGHADHGVQNRAHELALRAARERPAVVGHPCE